MKLKILLKSRLGTCAIYNQCENKAQTEMSIQLLAKLHEVASYGKLLWITIIMNV